MMAQDSCRRRPGRGILQIRRPEHTNAQAFRNPVAVDDFPEAEIIAQHLVPPTTSNYNWRQITVAMCGPWLKAREKKTRESHTQRTRPVTVKASAHRQQTRYSKGSDCRNAKALWRGLCYGI